MIRHILQHGYCTHNDFNDLPWLVAGKTLQSSELQVHPPSFLMRLINCVIVIGARGAERVPFTHCYYLPSRNGKMRGLAEGAVVSRRALSQHEAGDGALGGHHSRHLLQLPHLLRPKGQVLHPD